MFTELFWAKDTPRKSLLHHSIDAGMMCETLIEDGALAAVSALLPRGGEHDWLLPVAVVLSALHDIGKCHPYFQAQLPTDPVVKTLYELRHLSPHDKTLIHKYRHEIGGQHILERILNSKYETMPDAMRDNLTMVVRLHHQRISKEPDDLPSYYKEFWEREQYELFERICAAFQVNFSKPLNCAHMDAGFTMCWGLMVLSDWLASGQAVFYEIDESLSDAEYCQRSRQAAQEALSACGLRAVTSIKPKLFPDMFSYMNISRQGMRPLQIACEELTLKWSQSKRSPALVIIEASMGVGKTETALHITTHLMEAYHKSGFLDALPTAATSNSMWKRVNDFLTHNASGAAKLIHAQSWLVEHERAPLESSVSARDAAAWLAPTRRGLLAQYAVGTVDQVMMAVMRVRYGVLRLLGIASKVLVIDEVHAYDAYMLAIIEELLQWCAALRVPVILLSATLPKERRLKLMRAYLGAQARFDNAGTDAYPLITQGFLDSTIETRVVEGASARSRVYVERLIDPENWDEVAQLALERVAGGGCLGIILNTVGEAQALYSALEARSQCEPTFVDISLFHAGFPMEQRQAIEDACVSEFGKEGVRKPRAILVSTQVCEQSLDLDFDCMITYLCPIDLLLQRIGRMHRHERSRPESMREPHVIVITPEYKKLAHTGSAYVYDPWILRMSARALERLEFIDLPDDIRKLVEQVYGEKPDAHDESFEEWAKLSFGSALKSEAARAVLMPKPDARYFSMCESADTFRDEGADWIDPFDSARVGESAVVARTRMGMDGVRIAILDATLYDRAQNNSDKATAVSVLARSLSVSARWFDGGAPHNTPGAVEGDGLLRGVWLLLQNGAEAFEYTHRGKRVRIRCDKKLGILREEGDT